MRRPITYTVIQTILVKMVVDGNPLPCFLDQRLKKPTTSFANACVISLQVIHKIHYQRRQNIEMG